MLLLLLLSYSNTTTIILRFKVFVAFNLVLYSPEYHCYSWKSAYFAENRYRPRPTNGGGKVVKLYYYYYNVVFAGAICFSEFFAAVITFALLFVVFHKLMETWEKLYVSMKNVRNQLDFIFEVFIYYFLLFLSFHRDPSLVSRTYNV